MGHQEDDRDSPLDPGEDRGSKRAKKWKYLKSPVSKWFCTEVLPPALERDSFQDGEPFAYLYRPSPLVYPGYITRLVASFDRESIKKAFGGGKFLLKARRGRQGLTTRTVVIEDEEPILSEIEQIAHEAVEAYLSSMEGSRQYFQDAFRVEKQISTSPDWLRELLRRLGFRLRPARPRSDGKPYWFPLLDEQRVQV